MKRALAALTLAMPVAALAVPAYAEPPTAIRITDVSVSSTGTSAIIFGVQRCPTSAHVLSGSASVVQGSASLSTVADMSGGLFGTCTGHWETFRVTVAYPSGSGTLSSGKVTAVVNAFGGVSDTRQFKITV